jgi:hypothetical protein
MSRKNHIPLMILVSATLLSLSVMANAQSCGAGYIQHGGGGVVVCEPIVEAPPASVLQNPGPQWVTRWGAISVDLELGKFGGAQGLASKGKAEKAANKDCKKNGGKRCRSYSYYNQCGALAWGDNYLFRSSGPVRDKVMADAVSNCSVQSANCKPYYVGCSYPERVR